jgi:uncharacterized protein YbjQ (UPF0145 family)
MAGNEREELEALRKRRRLAELEAKASGGQQQPVDPNLQNFAVPDRMAGLPMPFAGEPTDYMTDSLSGFGVSVPSGAPDSVKSAMVEGARNEHRDRQAKTRLAVKGKLASITSPGRFASRGFGALSGDSERDDIRALERTGAFASGVEDFGTFGYSDELHGLTGGPEALSRQRTSVKDAWEQHPVSTLAGGATTFALPGQQVRGASTGGKVASGMLRGGIWGGLYGSGSGEDTADRFLKAGLYGTGGALTGGSLVAGGRGVDFLARKLPGSAELRALTSKIVGNKSLTTVEIKALEGAISEVQTVARANGRKIDRGAARNELIAAMRGGRPNDFMFEALGEEGVIAAQGAAQPGMAGATDIAEALGRRGEEQYARINSAVSKLAGGKNISSSLEELGRVKKDEASPIYEQAYKVPVNVNSPEFQAVELTRRLPEFQAGQTRGERIWRLETNNPDGKFKQLPYFRQIQYIKEGVDDQIGSLIKKGDLAQAGALIGRKNEWLGQVDTMNPLYGDARQMWAGAAAQKNALELGEKMLGTPGYSPTGARWREIQAAYAKMSEAEKVAFSVGMYDRAIQMAGDQAATATGNSVSRRMMTPNTEQRIREILPAEQADEFLELINREYTQQVTANRVLPAAGSKTSSAMNAVDAVRAATGGARAVAGQLAEPQRLLGRAQQGAREWMENNAKRQGSLTQFLLRQVDDPELQKALGLASPDPQLPPPSGGSAPPVANTFDQRTSQFPRTSTADVPEAPYYHGTSRPFDGSLDPNAPASSADNMARGGVFMSSNRDVASQYAQGPNARVLPVDPKVKNPMTTDMGGVEANDQAIQRLIDEAKAAGHDSLILRNIKDGAYKDAPVSDVMVVFRGEDAVIVPAPGSGAKPGLMDRIAAKGKDSERGNIVIDGRPMRRQDAMREARSAGGGSFPTAPAAPAARRPASTAMEQARGIGDSPLLPLLLMGGGGTAAVAGMNHFLNRPDAGNKAQEPEASPLQQAILGPSLKPDLSGPQQASVDRANTEARQQDQAQRAEYWDHLKSRGDGSSTEWNQIMQARASDLKVTPEDAARGIIRKRLPYAYDVPVSVLKDAPVEVLINGEWLPETALTVPNEQRALELQ